MERVVDRFDRYMEMRGLNDNIVTKDLSLSIGTIGKSRKDGRDLSRKVVEQILNFYTDLEEVWLLTGKGSMLKEAAPEVADKGEEATEGLVNLRVVHPSEADGVTTPRIVDDGEPVGRPYYDVDFMGGFGEFIDSPNIYPSYYIDYKPFNREGVFWVNVVGDSMSPELRSGDAVALRPIERWAEFLFYDRIYAVVTQDGQRTIKRIRRSSEQECFRLVPINPEYDEQDIPKGVIRAVFEVLGGIKNLG
ncbi:MAG: S24 family peptidase [Porphyromonadaceae bacterium]|nr:S24 family peptidase [Porphyromonadaceae bacterium]